MTDQQVQIYDDTVKIHLACLQLLAERNFLRWTSLDLGRQMYKSMVPEEGAWSTVYSDQHDGPIVIVGMACKEVRDSSVIINQTAYQLNRVAHVPLRAISVPQWSGEIRDLWPIGWYLGKYDKLEIKINWNGKEKPGTLDLAYFMMRY